MGIYLAEQTALFMQSILLGGAFGLLYDAFQITRIAVPTARWVVFIEDVLFFLICAASTFLFMMRAMQGEVRFFILLGGAIGMVLYFYSLSILIMGISEAIIRVIKAILRLIYRWILFPTWKLFYNIVLFIIRPARFLGLQIKKTIQRCKFSLKVRRKVLYNQLRSTFSVKAEEKKTASRAQKKRKPKANGKSHNQKDHPQKGEA